MVVKPLQKETPAPIYRKRLRKGFRGQRLECNTTHSPESSMDITFFQRAETITENLKSLGYGRK
jgi:hypothetical protein